MWKYPNWSWKWSCVHRFPLLELGCSQKKNLETRIFFTLILSEKIVPFMTRVVIFIWSLFWPQYYLQNFFHWWHGVVIFVRSPVQIVKVNTQAYFSELHSYQNYIRDPCWIMTLKYDIRIYQFSKFLLNEGFDCRV